MQQRKRGFSKSQELNLCLIYNPEAISLLKVLSPHQTINLNDKLKKNKVYGYLQTYGTPITPDVVKSMGNQNNKFASIKRPKTSNIALKKPISIQKVNNFRSISETNFPNYVNTSNNIDKEAKCKRLLQRKRNLNLRRQSLKNQIDTIRSDMLELKRDLSTYQKNFCDQQEPSWELMKFSQITQKLPQSFNKVKKIKQAQQDLQKELLKGFSTLSQLNELECFSELPIYHIRKESLYQKHIVQEAPTIFQGMRKISNLHCILQIQGQNHSDCFSIVVHLPSGQVLCNNVTIESDKNWNDTVLQRIKTQVIPFLYITLQNDRLELAWNNLIGISFLCGICQIKGLVNQLETILITEQNDDVILALFSQRKELNITKQIFGIQGNIFNYKPELIFRRICKSLFVQDTQLVWLNPNQSLFHVKEQKSRFLDWEYVSEQLGVMKFRIISKFTATINRNQYKIFVLHHKEVYKIRIRDSQDRQVEIVPESQLYQILRNLQFRDQFDYPLTLKSSIELEYVIKKLF